MKLDLVHRVGECVLPKSFGMSDLSPVFHDAQISSRLLKCLSGNFVAWT